MKYFITGGAGFIGSSMTSKLLKDPKNKLTIFDNFCSGKMAYLESYTSDPRFNIKRGDLLDLEAIKSAIKDHGFVFHFAANPDIAKAMTETDLDLKQTVIATFNLLEAMRLSGINKIAYSSGSGVYGDVGEIQTPENFGPLLPTSMYGASKLGAEGLISAFCNMFDMQSWIFRFANVVGKNQTHGVGFDFINKLRKNSSKLTILGDGSQSKSYIHISDILDAMLLIISKTNEKVNVYNVATDDYITVNEIAQIVTEEMNLKNVKFEYTGGNRGWKGDVPVVRFNLKKIHNLGWKAKYSSKEAIRKSIKEMLEEIKLLNVSE